MIEFAVRNPVKVSVGILLVALFGTVFLLRMPKQLTPEVQTPTITVDTRWPGASPKEVEREIVQEQEEQLKSVEGVMKMTSESKDSLGTITLEFQVGSDTEEMLLKVNSRLQQVPEYPQDADEPVITTASASDRPIAWFILSLKQASQDDLRAFAQEHPELKAEVEHVLRAASPALALFRLRQLADAHPEARQLLPPPIEVAQLRRFAEDYIEAAFERVPGVANSNVMGGLDEELQVVVDPARLAARRLTIADVRRVLQNQNQDTSGGDFWEGKRRWVVRTRGQFESPEQVERQVLAMRDGAPVYVRDVAQVRLGFKKPDGVVRRYGATTIGINAQRETGANVLEVMDGLQRATDELNRDVLPQRHLQLTQVYDETEYIHSAIGLVQENIFVGSALTMIVLMLFLHRGRAALLVSPLIAASALAAAYVSPWFFVLCIALILAAGFLFARGALVVGLAIPTSIIGTFVVLGWLGRSLNVISLAGLAFAVGMLVDNAVVVLENIYRRHEQGEPNFRAVVDGTREVLGAVVASTLTTIAVFLPVVFIQEEAGQLFRDIALAISAAVGLSLLVSVFLIPTAATRLLARGSEHGHDRQRSMIVNLLDRFGASFVESTVAINAWLQRGTLRKLSVVVLLVAVSLLGSYGLWPKVEYLPMGNRNLVFGILLPPPGYNLEQLMRLGARVEQELRPYWDVDVDSPEADALEYPPIADFFYVARGRQVFLGLRAHDPARAGELVPLVQQVTSTIPGAFAVAKQSSLFEQGLSAGRTIDVEISGIEIEKLVGLGGEILGKVAQLIPNAQARPVPSLDLSSPEVHVIPRLEEAAEMGVDARELGYTVDALVDGAYAADYFVGGDKIDLTIVGNERSAGRTQDLEALPMATSTGDLLPLGAVADVVLNSGPEQINHRERQRAITIEVSPPPEVALEDAMQRIDSQIVAPLVASGRLDDGYRITLAGTADKLRETWQALWFNFLLSLAITYLLMAALFESWLYPAVIIFSVPLGAVGGIAGLWLLNFYRFQSLDVLTMLGFVILVGTVVNNAILIVHQSLNHIRLEGMPESDAILESVRNRIRPIFMTTGTTVLGLLPLVLFPGAGSELYRGLGSVVLGGLVVSTVFTLVLVPALFSLALSGRRQFAQAWAAVRNGAIFRRTERSPAPLSPWVVALDDVEENSLAESEP